jgi:acylphosphatase
MSDSRVVRAHVYVTGLVQGVYFRASAADEARAFGLAGWIRNTAQGVEAVFEGPRENVEQAVAWCHEGPRRAVVESVEVTWEEPEGLPTFWVRH